MIGVLLKDKYYKLILIQITELKFIMRYLLSSRSFADLFADLLADLFLCPEQPPPPLFGAAFLAGDLLPLLTDLLAPRFFPPPTNIYTLVLDIFLHLL